MQCNFKDRLFKSGLATTILGVGILIFAAVLMYQQKAGPIELTGWLGIGLLFLRSKDSLIGVSKSENWKKDLKDLKKDILDNEQP